MTIGIVSLELTGNQTLEDKLLRLEELTQRGRLKEAWERMVELLGMTVRATAPAFDRDLIASFDEEVGMQDGEIAGTVFSNLVYAPFQERGTGPYFPNLDNIREWAEAKGGTAFGLALYIAEHGLKPTRYAERSLLQEENEIVALVGEVIAEILEESY